MENNFIDGKQLFFQTENMKQEEYLRTSSLKYAETLAQVVEEITKLDIPDETVKDWEKLIVLLRIFDNKIDNISDDANKSLLIHNIIDFLNGEEDVNVFLNDRETREVAIGIKKLCKGLEEKQERLFRNLLSHILRVTEKIKTANDPKVLVKLTGIEGRTAAKLFLPFLPEGFRLSSNYRKLVRMLTKFGRAANSFDSFVDMKKDHKNNQILIKPHLLNRVRFLGLVLTNSVSLMKDLGLSADLWRKFLFGLKDTALSYPEKKQV